MKKIFGMPVQQSRQDVCDPSKLALLVYDMQVGIVSQLKGCGPATTRMAQALDAARKAGVRIFFTRICRCRGN
jgi:nicotinamidase-related amidase